MARLYANENFPLGVVNALRELGHDVLTTREAGRDNQAIEDHDVLLYATQEQRTLLTINRRDFIQLHRTVSDHAGIIVCTEDADLRGQASRIDTAIRSAGPLTELLLRVYRSVS